MQHAPCGCVVHFQFDDAEPQTARTHTAVDPALDDGLPWTIGGDQRKRVECAAHAGADHHEHFRKLRLDQAGPAIAAGQVAIDVLAGGGLHYRVLKTA